MINNLKNWLLYSSENPEKISLTVKGVLVACVPFFASIVALIFNVQIDQSATLELASQIAVAIGAILAVYGAGRKVKNTITRK